MVGDGRTSRCNGGMTILEKQCPARTAFQVPLESSWITKTLPAWLKKVEENDDDKIGCWAHSPARLSILRATGRPKGAKYHWNGITPGPLYGVKSVSSTKYFVKLGILNPFVKLGPVVECEPFVRTELGGGGPVIVRDERVG